MSHDPQASASRLKIDFAQASDPGRDPNKQVNEDSCGYAETRFGHLAVLCDGMGGHYGGKEASRTAITTIFEMFEQMPLTMAPPHALKLAIEEAGRRVYLLGGPPENRTRPGSTVVAMLLHDRGLEVAHVGDSRAYVIRSNQIYPLTRDHSMVQGMIDAGMLTEESAMGHPDSNKITRALGMRPDVDVELRPEVMELFAGDVLLQSSDGLTDLALGRDILGATRQAMASGGVEHACTMLVKMANDRGGHDNITVQMVRILEVAPKVQSTIPERPVMAAAEPRPQPQPQMQMTAADGTPQSMAYPARPQPTHDGGPRPQPQPQPAAGMAWSPVMPTAPGATPSPAQVAPSPYGPTLSEQPAPQPWTAAGFQAAHAGHTGQPGRDQAQADAADDEGGHTMALAPMSEMPSGMPAPGLAAYRLDAGPASLPLPPVSRGYGAPPSQQVGYAPNAGGTPLPGPASMPGGFTPAPGGFAPPSPSGGPPALYGQAQPPSRGGIVFVILGMSAVIAVLILVVVWALWLR
jgi:serine/threonine protein phosphatase PrpC